MYGNAGMYTQKVIKTIFAIDNWIIITWPDLIIGRIHIEITQINFNAGLEDFNKIEIW